jgi:hypothetical protein
MGHVNSTTGATSSEHHCIWMSVIHVFVNRLFPLVIVQGLELGKRELDSILLAELSDEGFIEWKLGCFRLFFISEYLSGEECSAARLHVGYCPMNGLVVLVVKLVRNELDVEIA